jgi:AraC-like DNA-binding protein
VARMKTYLRHRSLNLIDVKELIVLEYLDFEGKYRDYTENHDFCELCFVESGNITLTLGDTKEELSSGDIIYIEPGIKHSYYSEAGNKSRAFVICFTCPSYTLKLLSCKPLVVGDDELYCIKKIIEESRGTYRVNEKELLEVLAAPSFGGQQAIILQLEYLLIGLLRKLTAAKGSGIVILSGEKFYPDLVNIVISHLKSNIDKKIKLNDICSRFNYSRSFICKIFKEQTGISLITYFNKLKIEEAKRMLVETDMSAITISEHLGFSEAKYFGAIFKKQEGMSPLSYREQNAKKTDPK